MEKQSACTLCPRRCGVNRETETGFCGARSVLKVARAAPHFWEEPCISGARGSGTVFFAGCNLRCSICQNFEISFGDVGKTLQAGEVADVFLRLAAEGVHNINLVTPTPWRVQIQQALRTAKQKGLALPIVWNTSGYETAEAVRSLQNDVDIWLTDLKFFAPSLSLMVANAPDYFEEASAAVIEMINQSGPPAFDAEGILRRGTVIRILVLPGYREDAKNILRWMAGHLHHGEYLVSIMSQYTPAYRAREHAALSRRLTTFEYQDVMRTAAVLGITNGYTQNRGSASNAFTPPFDLTGL